MHCFVGLKEGNKHTYLFAEPGGKKVREVLWGDWLTLDDDQAGVKAGWVRIIWGPKSDKPQTLYIPKADTSDERPLEIIFVDVGQGDGCVVISPERDPSNEKVIVIDAGEGHEMADFLANRFNGYKAKMQFHAAVITHPDQDHYKGFQPIFENHNFGFDKVYHSGLVERAEGSQFDKFGGLITGPDGTKYVAKLAETDQDIRAGFADPSTFGQKAYPPMIHAAISNPGVKKFALLSTPKDLPAGAHTWMDGFGPDDGRGYTIEVLGPVTETISGKKRLRKLGGYAQTKNAHSVVLRLRFGEFAILLGGDLNTNAEKFLLAHYGGVEKFPRKRKDEETNGGAYSLMLAEASQRLRCEIMKVCHHGARDVTDEFIGTVNPACFVISSGDAEGHVHPRPDLLGRLGKQGRSASPVLLSTELQRSTRAHEDEETVKKLKDEIETYRQKAAAAEAAPGSAAKQTAKDKAQKAMNERIDYLARDNVDVYGAIYLKTDGKRLITAFRIEEPSLTKTWFWFEYVRSVNGDLEPVS